MRKFVLPSLLIAALLLSGCYRAQVTTDRTPSNQTIEKRWATGFIYGLAMTGTDMDGTEECDAGVAEVETKLSFPNQLVSLLTAGIYTPMDVRITCAQSGSSARLMEPPSDLDLAIEKDATKAEIRETLSTASLQSAITQEPVEVKIFQ